MTANPSTKPTLTVLTNEDYESMNLEQQLEQSANMTVTEAKAILISSNEEYQDAADFLNEIKKRSNAIVEYWQKPKQAAKAAHQEIVDKEKAMLQPLKNAERIVKDSMLDYQKAVEKARREAEAEARRKQQEAAEQMLAQAIAEADKGNKQEAEVKLAVAEMISELPAPANVGVEKPKAQGISISKTWKARVVDASKVPAYFNGMEIRQIHLPSLNSLARMTKGTAEVPGIEFYEESSLSARI